MKVELQYNHNLHTRLVTVAYARLRRQKIDVVELLARHSLNECMKLWLENTNVALVSRTHPDAFAFPLTRFRVLPTSTFQICQNRLEVSLALSISRMYSNVAASGAFDDPIEDVRHIITVGKGRSTIIDEQLSYGNLHLAFTSMTRRDRRVKVTI